MGRVRGFWSPCSSSEGAQRQPALSIAVLVCSAVSSCSPGRPAWTSCPGMPSLPLGPQRHDFSCCFPARRTTWLDLNLLVSGKNHHHFDALRVWFFFLSVLETEARVSSMLDQCSYH